MNMNNNTSNALELSGADAPIQAMSSQLLSKSDLSEQLKDECTISNELFKLGSVLEQSMQEHITSLEAARVAKAQVAQLRATAVNDEQIQDAEHRQLSIETAIANLRASGLKIADQIKSLRLQEDKLKQQHAKLETEIKPVTIYKSVICLPERFLNWLAHKHTVIGLILVITAPCAWLASILLLELQFGLGHLVGIATHNQDLALGTAFFSTFISILAWFLPGLMLERGNAQALYCLKKLQNLSALIEGRHRLSCKCKYKLPTGSSITEACLQNFSDQSKDAFFSAKQAPLVLSPAQARSQIKKINAELVNMQSHADTLCDEQKQLLAQLWKNLAAVKAIDDLSRHLAAMEPTLFPEELLAASLVPLANKKNHAGVRDSYQAWCSSTRQSLVNNSRKTWAEMKELGAQLKDHQGQMHEQASLVWQLRTLNASFIRRIDRTGGAMATLVELRKISKLFGAAGIVAYLFMAVSLAVLLLHFNLAAMWWLWHLEIGAVIALPACAIWLVGALTHRLCAVIADGSHKRYVRRPLKPIEEAIEEMERLQAQAYIAKKKCNVSSREGIPSWLQ